MQKRMTIQDIARIAKVSSSTVSRSLNDSSLVNHETKARIRTIARKGNFAFNATARSLVLKRTGNIGLICPDSYDEYQYSLHLTLLINRIRGLLEKDERDLIIKFRHDSKGRNSVKELINAGKIDGLFIINPDISQDEVQFIHDYGIPVVFLQAIPPKVNLETEDYVFADHVAGGIIATDHLIRLGHKRIICFTVDTPEASFHERTRGYQRAIDENNLQQDNDLVVVGDGTFEFAYDFVTQNSAFFRDSGVTAIFSQTDIMTLGAIEGLWNSNLKVPGDVAVVSYDDIGFGKDFRPRLTTIHQPRDRLAVSACNRLNELLSQDGPDTETSFAENTLLQRRVQPYLIVRETCGAESGQIHRRLDSPLESSN